MGSLTAEQAQALRRIVAMITETVAEAGPNGAPSGHLYAALMTAGCTLSQYQSLIGALVKTGHLVQRGDVLFAGKVS